MRMKFEFSDLIPSETAQIGVDFSDFELLIRNFLVASLQFEINFGRSLQRGPNFPKQPMTSRNFWPRGEGHAPGTR